MDYLSNDIINKYNKLLIVGHENSNLESIVELCKSIGFKEANQLKKEKIYPNQISEILIQAHKDNTIDGNMNNIKVNPVWDGLAMDLMISNLDHSKFMWFDYKALPLLNYWSKIDESIAFVLVYNSPEVSIKNIIEKTKDINKKQIENYVERWFNYNRLLLDCFHSNINRAILINTDNLHRNNYKKNGSLELTLLREVVYINDDIHSLYTELEAFSNSKEYEINESNFKMLALEEFYSRNQYFKEIRENINFVNSENKKLKEYNSQLLDKLLLAVEEVESNSSLNKINVQTESSFHEIEKEVILNKLLTSLEEIERLHNQNFKNLKQKNKKMYGAPDRIKRQLSYRLGDIMINKSKSIKGLFLMPFTLYTEIKLFKKERKNQKKLPPIHTYADYYESEKIKKHLSFRLGEAMILSFRTPFFIFTLPINLKKAYDNYKKERN